MYTWARLATSADGQTGRVRLPGAGSARTVLRARPHRARSRRPPRECRPGVDRSRHDRRGGGRPPGIRARRRRRPASHSQSAAGDGARCPPCRLSVRLTPRSSAASRCRRRTTTEHPGTRTWTMPDGTPSPSAPPGWTRDSPRSRYATSASRGSTAVACPAGCGCPAIVQRPSPPWSTRTATVPARSTRSTTSPGRPPATRTSSWTRTARAGAAEATCSRASPIPSAPTIGGCSWTVPARSRLCAVSMRSIRPGSR